ncbi:DUF1295 domain-containing protein [Leptospira levettii]|uniref:DUF1295 domain-containing protein n=1 Tax=Leptospira levettii TaxID=2023178 RepID=UPI0010839BF4|nr:DUF1295 domain-containing protein [Leptospira levettii]MCW7509429.1 DUF1295 domain-containing protein [Leptospira levettii]MCW7520747.1 DUF1295 domain-containing protein [Leptospira levettii]TGM40549.1 DUF1295 domain-containing protein [Leptospira levettii]
MDNILVPYLTAVIFTFCFMTLMWFWGKTRDNYAVIDVGWGLVIAGIATVLSYFGKGTLAAKLVVLIPVWVWAIRLSGFLYFTRIRTNHPEDKRYAGFRKDYGDKVHSKMFTNVFLLQGALALLLSFPFYFASQWDLFPNVGLFGPNGTLMVWIGWILFVFGVVGETIADKDLHKFLSVPANKGKVCNVGLWKYTRHPNYFFEWVIWLGIGVIPILSTPEAMASLFTPVFMFVLLRFVSGVPFAEKYSLQSKGDLFREYMRTTNAFFPWFPKQ